MPAYEVKTDGRSRTDILREYINSSVYLPYDKYAYQFASQEAFDTFLIPDDINRRINNDGILMTPIEYIIYSALIRHISKHIPQTPAGAEAPRLEGVYRLIDLFIKRGAKFSYDRRKFNNLLTPEVTKYFDNRKEVEEYNSVLRQMDDYYRSRLPASSTSAAASRPLPASSTSAAASRLLPASSSSSVAASRPLPASSSSSAAVAETRPALTSHDLKTGCFGFGCSRKRSNRRRSTRRNRRNRSRKH